MEGKISKTRTKTREYISFEVDTASSDVGGWTCHMPRESCALASTILRLSIFVGVSRSVAELPEIIPPVNDDRHPNWGISISKHLVCENQNRLPCRFPVFSVVIIISELDVEELNKRAMTQSAA